MNDASGHAVALVEITDKRVLLRDSNQNGKGYKGQILEGPRRTVVDPANGIVSMDLEDFTGQLNAVVVDTPPDSASDYLAWRTVGVSRAINFFLYGGTAFLVGQFMLSCWRRLRGPRDSS
jgi:hypothetical protein